MLDSSLPLTCAGAMCATMRMKMTRQEETRRLVMFTLCVVDKSFFLLHSLASFYSHKNNKKNWAKIIEMFFEYAASSVSTARRPLATASGW